MSEHLFIEVMLDHHDDDVLALSHGEHGDSVNADEIFTKRRTLLIGKL